MIQSIDAAFQAVPRRDFLRQSARSMASLDMPLPIGHGQTNSQPTTVHMMLSWLGAKTGDKVLDVGSGSGWTTALLAYLVGPKGQVYAVEKVPELVTFGSDNCKQLGVKNTKFFASESTFGLPKFAPYDRILVSASATKLPKELINQLKVGGKLVIPVKEDVLEITKISNLDVNIVSHPGFVFVPLLP